ncbi:hypothetical protein CLV47_11362 [Antricoccus suffuscus]|uniref:Uncharacterized protein n=1 Tax=Antricoccus suffuscus TaxID=1629062 RepID=A0A2T0ZXD1_9ACTN|nr:hypothetical protein [Antricoccus suffuscus]PRZ40897.1 hypothetical protein CLV47_11362 [Antricoccus suffuscus]
MTHEPHEPAPEPVSVETTLITSASRSIELALTAWSADDTWLVGVLAPTAVEHLGKVALWRRNPALLVKLTSNMELSLFILTTRATLADPRVRTIGLDEVLQRLDRCVDDFGLTKDEAGLITNARNGSVHVGLPSDSTKVGLFPSDLTDTDPRAYPETVRWAEAAWLEGLSGVTYMCRHYNSSKAFCLFGDRLSRGALQALPGHASTRVFALPSDAEWLASLALAMRVVIRP